MQPRAHARTRPGSRFRTLGWLAAAVLTLAALLAPAASPVLADHTIDLGHSGTDQSGLCTGDYFKVESTASLREGTHAYTGTTVGGVTFTAVLTVELDADNEVGTITVVSTDPAFALIIFKAGTVFETTMGTVVMSASGKAISNIAFCGLIAEGPTPTPTPEATPTPTPEATPTPTPEATPTPTPTPEATPTPTPMATPTPTPTPEATPTPTPMATPTPTPEATPTPTPTPEATPTPTPMATPTPTPVATPTPTPTPEDSVGGETPAPTPTPTPTPEDSVGGETGTPPAVTLPPTDTGNPGSSPASNTWRMVLITLGALIAGALLLTPPGRPVRRD